MQIHYQIWVYGRGLIVLLIYLDVLQNLVCNNQQKIIISTDQSS